MSEEQGQGQTTEQPATEQPSEARAAKSAADLAAMLMSDDSAPSSNCDPEAGDQQSGDGAVVEPEPAAEAGSDDAGEVNGDDEKVTSAKFAKALVDLERERGLRLRTDKELKALKALVEEAKGDVTKALGLAGKDPDSLIQEMLDGKLKKKEPDLTPEQQEQIELRNQVEQLVQEREQIKAREVERQELDFIAEQIKDNPVVGAFPWAKNKVREVFYKLAESSEEAPTLGDAIDLVEQHIANDAKNVLGSEAMLKRLIELDPSLKASVVKALGIEPAPKPPEKSQPAQQDINRASTKGTTVLTQKNASEVPARSPERRRLSAKEEREMAARILMSTD